jgi:hypothetical protein
MGKTIIKICKRVFTSHEFEFLPLAMMVTNNIANGDAPHSHNTTIGDRHRYYSITVPMVVAIGHYWHHLNGVNTALIDGDVTIRIFNKR